MSDRIQRLEDLVTRLRGPNGCPWDREQEIPDIRAYLLEEAHEVAAAVDAVDHAALETELGDLLFQVIFLAKLAEEAGHFDLSSVISKIHDKMVARHPHVFGDEHLGDSAAVRQAWERRKAREHDDSVLAGLPKSMPALLTSYRMTQKVAAVGFDWPNLTSVIDKIEEELGELKEELSREPVARKPTREEVGDLLFTVANLARQLEVDPESALAEANLKFRRRFQQVEAKLREQGLELEKTSLRDLDALWTEVKDEEGGDAPA